VHPVRRARLSDAETIARVHAASWRETCGKFVDDPDTSPWFRVDRRIAMWQATLREDSHTTAVAEGEGASSDSPRRHRRQNRMPSVPRNSR
jgi:hypothetical protein